MAKVVTLERPLYSCAEAARLLDLWPATLRWWLEGGVRGGTVYPPVIRPEPTGVDVVTWGEFVEARLLNGYRQKRVSLQKMRPFIEGMRASLGVPYPLAHCRPMVDPTKRKLIYDLQLETKLPREMYLVEFEGGQTALAPPMLQFLERVELDDGDVPIRYWPEGRDSPVVIDPTVAFGVPQIKGIRTELVAESVAAGESEATVARSWGLTPADVKAAIDWEHRKAA
ncbi:MAG TPA: DUF433 domain-containing protein [Solirubrobacteraceae bacterium]|jgi:uncharacterized protein (DUF433 family)|nr:DUF433 domain-containing protein [Solirubrobacteraceae bacterium]